MDNIYSSNEVGKKIESLVFLGFCIIIMDLRKTPGNSPLSALTGGGADFGMEEFLGTETMDPDSLEGL